MHTTPIKKISKRASVAFLIFSNVLFFIIPIILLAVAILKFTSCPEKWYLPVWMIYVAVLIAIDRLIFWKRLVNETKFEKTFPRPDMYKSAERLRTWEKNRLSSSSRWLLWGMSTVRVQLFLAILCGSTITHEALQLDESQCDHTLAWTGLLFCMSAVWIFAFAVIGAMYIYCASLLTKLDQTATAALNRLM